MAAEADMVRRTGSTHMIPCPVVDSSWRSRSLIASTEQRNTVNGSKYQGHESGSRDPAVSGSWRAESELGGEW
jgi:hypothetical protein